jgi:hypothetical protein
MTALSQVVKSLKQILRNNYGKWTLDSNPIQSSNFSGKDFLASMSKQPSNYPNEKNIIINNNSNSSSLVDAVLISSALSGSKTTPAPSTKTKGEEEENNQSNQIFGAIIITGAMMVFTWVFSTDEWTSLKSSNEWATVKSKNLAESYHRDIKKWVKLISFRLSTQRFLKLSMIGTVIAGAIGYYFCQSIQIAPVGIILEGILGSLYIYIRYMGSKNLESQILMQLISKIENEKSD